MQVSFNEKLKIKSSSITENYSLPNKMTKFEIQEFLKSMFRK